MNEEMVKQAATISTVADIIVRVARRIAQEIPRSEQESEVQNRLLTELRDVVAELREKQERLLTEKKTTDARGRINPFQLSSPFDGRVKKGYTALVPKKLEE